MRDIVAGRALDERVTRAVWPDPDAEVAPIWVTRLGRGFLGPEFSVSREWAMTLLDELARRGWRYSYVYSPDYGNEHRAHEVHLWRVGTSAEDGPWVAEATLPLAVCAAVLVALEPEEGGDE